MRKFHQQFRVAQLLQGVSPVGVRYKANGHLEFVRIGEAEFVAKLGGGQVLTLRGIDEMVDGVVEDL